jgi:hypothetical protein
MSYSGALRGCLERWRVSSWAPGYAGAQVLSSDEAKRTRASWKPNEPERGGPADGLAVLAACTNDRARGGAEVDSWRHPSHQRQVRDPNKPERSEIRTLHAIVLVGGGALGW